MLKSRSLINLLVLIFDFSFCIYFFCSLFWGSWNELLLRAFFYFIQGCILMYFIIDMLRGHVSRHHENTVLIYLLSLVGKFWLFSAILMGLLKYPIFYLFLYSGLMIVISLVVVLNDKWHGKFD